METTLPQDTVAAALSPDEARAIAKEAYIYGFPVVDNYRIEYSYFVDRENPEFKAAWNQITNIPRVFTPADKAVQTPNSDTPYSWLGLDLRAEPIVITLPPIEKGATTAFSSLTPTHSILPTWALAPLVTTVVASWSPDRTGRGKHRGRKEGNSLRD